MKIHSIFLISILLSCFTYNSMAQAISVHAANGMSPDHLINTYLAGPGISLHNCKFNWSSSNINGSQVGYFTNSNPSFPFTSGIILTTGNISVAPGPNDETGDSETEGVNHATIDSDLQGLLSSGTVSNASVLEFNFNSTLSNTFSFSYIFGSEEYPEYVCSDYNDVFGFFLTGPDPYTGNLTTKNIAIIPNTISTSNPNGIPVSINALNSGNVGSSGSSSNCTSLAYSQYYVNNNNGTAVQYDGYTTPLVATAQLHPCAEYKMKVSIANVGDNAYDSGVFLKQGSFTLPTLTVTHDPRIENDTIIKNCNYSTIKMKYSMPLEQDLFVRLSDIGGTASIDNDYHVLLLRNNGNIDTVHNNYLFQFPVGDTMLVLRLEMKESAHFNLNQVKNAKIELTTDLCNPFVFLDGSETTMKQHDTLSFFLIDNERFTLTSDSIFYCDACHHVALQMTGGTEPLLYNWSPANLLATPHARESNCNVEENTTFQIIVHDRWNCLIDTGYHTTLITSTPELEGHYHITPNVICVPEEVQFVSNATPATTHQWIIFSENMTDTIYGPNETYTFTDPGRYSITYTAYEAKECAATVTLSNYINAGSQPSASFTFDPAEAEVGQNVMFTNESSGQNLHYIWSFGDGSNSSEENPIHVYNSENSENYNVILTASDDAGCQDKYSLPVPVVDNHVLYVPNSFTPNEDGVNDIFLPIVTNVSSYHLVIYDRRGGLVFSTDNPEEGWEGKYADGKECPSGIYTYYINYIRYNNLRQELIKTGTINLIR